MTRRFAGAGLSRRGSRADAAGSSVSAPPVLASLDVSSGTEFGGTAVTLTGTGLTGATAVTFGGVAAGSVVAVNDTTVTCAAPGIYTLRALSSTATDNRVDVTVTTAAGSSTLTNAFTYTSEFARILGSLWHKEHRASDPAMGLNGGNVSSWPCFNGNGAIAQATASKQPAFQATGWNGGPCVTGDGADDFVQGTMSTTIGAGKRPAWWLATKIEGGIGKYFGSLSDNAETTDYLSPDYTGGATFRAWRGDSSGFQHVTTGPATDTNRHLISLRLTSDGVNTLVVDATGANSTKTGSVSGSMTKLTIGAAPNSSNAGNNSYTIIVVANDMPSAQQFTDIVTAYKTAKFFGYTGSSLGLP